MEGAATNPPKPDATTNPPETVKIQLSEGKGFEVPRQYEKLFDDVPKLKESLLHGDKTIADLKAEMDTYNTKVTDLEQQLAERKVTDPFENVPDPMDNPREFTESVELKAERKAEARVDELMAKGEVHRSENGIAANLVMKNFGADIEALESEEEKTRFFTEKITEMAGQMKKLGLVEQVGKKFYTKEGAAEAAFNTLYMGELISRAEKKGAGAMGEQLEKSSQAGTSIPAETPGAAAPGSVDEALAKDPEGTMQKAFEQQAKEIEEREKRLR